jgi:hypothetical protein
MRTTLLTNCLFRLTNWLFRLNQWECSRRKPNGLDVRLTRGPVRFGLISRPSRASSKSGCHSETQNARKPHPANIKTTKRFRAALQQFVGGKIVPR